MIAFENKRETDKPDAELVSESLAGDRSAFSQIVVRYQTLISGLAYSATGSLSRSEDLAQDVFVRAWKELPQLREPAKLRPWLCSIARFMISKARRRDQHEPIHSAEPLDQAPELPTIEPWPSEGAINREEEMILWRSLKRIPEPYREPLVLFYREHQSIQRVAAALDLTEDAVKQRLSRGRKLLHQEVLLFVEGALERTNPGPALGLAVMAAIGVGTISAKAATVGTVAMSGKSAATAKGMSLLGGVGVAAMFLAAVGGQFAALWGRIRNGRSPRERRFLAQSTLGFFGWKLLLLIGVFTVMSLNGGALVINSLSDAVPWIGLWIGLLGLWVAYSTWMARRQKAIRLVEETSVVADTGKPHDRSDVDHSALASGVYGGLAAWIFGPGGLLIWLTHSKGNGILSGLLFALAIATWVVSARICLRHPGKIRCVFSAVMFGQALVMLTVVNLLWPSWVGRAGEFHFAPAVVNCLILGFYGSLGLIRGIEKRLATTS